jgi:hypothetical protein
VILLPLLSLAAGWSPTAAYKQFKSWASVCDNGLRCEASSEKSDPAGNDVSLHLRREPGPRSGVYVSFSSSENWPRRHYSLEIDGRSFPLVRAQSGVVVPTASALTAARALASATDIALVGGRERYRFSPQGAAAALRDIDIRQGRAGTVTAISETGPRAASSVPRAPALPVLTEWARPTHGPIIRPSMARLAQWRQAAGCDADIEETSFPPTSWAIDRRTAVILVGCHINGHDNEMLIRVGRAADGSDAHPAIFDFDFSLSEGRRAAQPRTRPSFGTPYLRIRRRGGRSHFF